MDCMLITFCVVARNEAAAIGRLLDNLCKQTYPHQEIECIFIDGLSDDETKHIFEAFAQQHDSEFRRILVLDNPGRTLPCGWNVALAHYAGDAIVRVDAHAEIPEDFIERNVQHISGGDDVCGGHRPNIIDEDTPWKRTLLAAETSMFGSSISSFRRDGEDRCVDSVFHGMYRRQVFDRVGRYNEVLARTEDNDMHYRIRQAGYQIRFHPDIVSYEHTRNTLKGMLRQKYLNGFWIGRTLGVTPGCVSLYYLVPMAFVLGIVLTTVLACLGHPLLGLVMWCAYLALMLLFSVMEWRRGAFHPDMLLLPVLFFLLHVCYGVGTLLGLVGMPLWRMRISRKEN